MDIADFYKQERYGGGDEAVGEYLAPRLAVVARALKSQVTAGMRVLDVGAGDGSLLAALVKDYEIDPYAVELSALRSRQLQARGIRAFEVDISKQSVSIAHSSIDIVVMTELIEHVFDGQQAIDEVWRVLKPGGLLYITTHNSFNLWMRLKYLIGIIPAPSLDVTGPTKGEHIRLFNDVVLRRLLQRAGFTQIEARHFFKYKNRCVPIPIFASLLATHLFLVAEK